MKTAGAVATGMGHGGLPDAGPRPRATPARRRQRHSRQTWDTAATTRSERLGSWEHQLDSSFLRFDITISRPDLDAFRAVTTRREFGELALVETAVTPSSGRRGRREIAVDPGWAGVSIVTSGRERVSQGNRELLLGPGDCIVWDGDIPAGFDVLEPLRKLNLLLPRERVVGLGLGRSPSRIPAGSAHGRLLAGYLRMLAAELDHLDSGASAAAANAALELVRAAIAPTTSSGLRALSRQEICRWIEARLHDVSLAPSEIARANAVSVRTLHALFEPTGESVGAYVRRLRLEHAGEELRARPDLSVTAVACRWGFQSVAHFSRSFRAGYGCSPTEYRSLDTRVAP